MDYQGKGISRTRQAGPSEERVFKSALLEMDWDTQPRAEFIHTVGPPVPYGPQGHRPHFAKNGLFEEPWLLGKIGLFLLDIESHAGLASLQVAVLFERQEIDHEGPFDPSFCARKSRWWSGRRFADEVPDCQWRRIPGAA